MFDWLQNMRKSAAEKEQEAITAYLDGAMSDRETAAFELRLRDDADLQREVESQRAVKMLLVRTPRLRAPRNFVLDPAVYGRQKPQAVPLSARLFPQLRTATLVATLLFAVVFTLNLSGTGAPLSQDVAMAPAAEREFPEVASEPVVDQAAVVESVVEESIVEEAADEMAEFSVEETADEAMPDPPADGDDTVELEMIVEEEMAEAEMEPTEFPPMTIEVGVTMSEAAAGSTEFETADGAADGGGELQAPRATATPDSNRVADDEIEESEPLATPAPLPTIAPSEAPDTAEESAAVAAEPAEVEQTATNQPENTGAIGYGLNFTSWLAVLLGGLSMVLLGLTLWAWRQRRRLP